MKRGGCADKLREQSWSVARIQHKAQSVLGSANKEVQCVKVRVCAPCSRWQVQCQCRAEDGELQERSLPPPLALPGSQPSRSQSPPRRGPRWVTPITQQTHYFRLLWTMGTHWTLNTGKDKNGPSSQSWQFSSTPCVWLLYLFYFTSYSHLVQS